MIRIEYEEYMNDFDNRANVRTFETLKGLENWIFEQFTRPTSTDHAMYFPKKESISRITFRPKWRGYSYFIHAIYYNNQCVFTDGSLTNGEKFMSTAIDNWLRHCEERRFAKPKFEDVEDIE